MVTRKPVKHLPPRKPVAARPLAKSASTLRPVIVLLAVLTVAGIYCGRTAFAWLHSPGAVLAAPVHVTVEPSPSPVDSLAMAPSPSPAVRASSVPSPSPTATIRPTDVPPAATAVLPTALRPAPTATAMPPTATLAPSPTPSIVPTRTPQDSPSLLSDAAAGLASLAQRGAVGQKPGPFTILIAVADAGAVATTQSNAGAFVVGRVDPERNTASWVSLPADLQVQIPGAGSGRLDSVIAAGEKLVPGGGAPFLKQTLEQNLQTGINFYLVVDREGLAKGIDQSGMISVTVPYPLGDSSPVSDPYNAPAVLLAGPQLLDGLSMSEYLYARDQAGDTDHFNKVRAVADAVIRWARRPGAIEQALIAVVDQTAHLKTNLRANQILGMFWLLRQVQPSGFVLYQVDSNMIGSNGVPRWDRIRPLFADWKK